MKWKRSGKRSNGLKKGRRSSLRIAFLFLMLPFVSDSCSFLSILNALPGLRAAWIERVEGVDTSGDRDQAMRALRPVHESFVQAFSGNAGGWHRAEQVHGSGVATIPCDLSKPAPDGLPVVPEVDGLITQMPGETLAIYVADCGVIWLADRKTGAIGLLHSGKKGTELGILTQAIQHMQAEFGTQSSDLVVVLGPCIRPPDYEIDFAREIQQQAKQAGVGLFHDCGLNTAADLSRFYSYRKEMGKTGRMLALIVRDFLP